MKDEKGIYYYPFPQNKKVRMYVRKSENTIFFRLWNSGDHGLWEEHGWLPFEAIEKASMMYNQKNFDPSMAYDMETAKALLKDVN